jgi:hypothetical protein
MVNLNFLLPKDITKEERDALWDAGVDMDDWDYMLIIPDKEITTTKWTNHPDTPPNHGPLNYWLEHYLLDASWRRKTEWYRVEFRGEQVGMGIAYH